MPLGKATYTIEDAKGALAQTAYWIDYPEFITDQPLNPIEYAQELGALMDEIIDGKLVGINFTTNVPLPSGIKTSAIATADVEDGGLCIWEAGNYETVRQTIPTMAETYFNRENVCYVTAESPYELWLFVVTVENPTEVAADWGVWPTNVHGVQITNLRVIEQKFKRSRR